MKPLRIESKTTVAPYRWDRSGVAQLYMTAILASQRRLQAPRFDAAKERLFLADLSQKIAGFAVQETCDKSSFDTLQRRCDEMAELFTELREAFSALNARESRLHQPVDHFERTR